MGQSGDDALAARIGTTLGGKYKLNRLIGQGGMGAVFDAVNTWTERRVAVKLKRKPEFNAQEFLIAANVLAWCVAMHRGQTLVAYGAAKGG